MDPEPRDDCAEGGAEQDAASRAKDGPAGEKPQRFCGACSARKTMELVYSPPTATPWSILRITKRTAAAISHKA